MPNDLQPTPQFPPAVPDPAEPSRLERGPIAPLWHTILIVALILANSFAGSSKVAAIHGSPARILLYAGTFITQLILILLVWFGIRKRGVRMRDLIGGRWKTVEDFLIDVGIASAFFVVAALVL